VGGAQDTAGQISLQLRSGNSNANFSSNQITLGYNNTATYRHAIKTRHNSGAVSGNAIDFYTWKQGTDTDVTIGTQHVMSLDGPNVGVGTTTPTAKLQLAGNADSLIFDADSSGFNGRYALLPGRTVVGTIGSGYPDLGYNFTTNNSVYTKIANDTAWGIGLGGSNYMSFKYAAAGTGTFSWITAMLIDLTGKIGIGGTPNHKLDIFGNIAAEAGQAEDITTRIKGGFWETNTATTAEGWPVTTNSWYHLISSTHSNTGNYYSLQIAGDFFSQNFYIRSTADQGSRAWSRLMLGSGTTNYVPKFTAANSLGNSLIYDDGSYVGIGNPSPGYRLDVSGSGASIIRAKGGGQGYVQAAILLQTDTTDSPQARGTGVYTFNEGTDATWYFGNGYQHGDYLLINRKSGTTWQEAAANPDESSNFVSIDNIGRVGIGNKYPAYKLDVNGDTNVNGVLTATIKSFVIDHPTKPGMKLQYGVLEGPEHSVYVRGKLVNNDTIILPDHWINLVHEDSITVNLTPIGKHQNLYVDYVDSEKVIVKGEENINCYYTVFAERKDVDKLKIEY
jgi:hypothetical protein